MFRFYPTLDADSVRNYLPVCPFLLPASSWARQRNTAEEAIPVPHIPEQVTEIAADSGGFAAALRARKLGVEDGYGYSPEQYVTWLQALGPRLSWAATMDYPCEQPLAGDDAAVRQRQARTTEMAWLFWQHYREEPYAWVPTIQGWSVADYRRHAQELRPLLEEMAVSYGPESAWRVGIGTLCKRANVALVHQVCCAVAQVLPGFPLHVWGVSLRLFRAPIALPAEVQSFDSSSWNRLFYRDKEAWHASGLSQRRWTIQVALPEYLAKLECAWSRPKQLSLPLAA